MPRQLVLATIPIEMGALQLLELQIEPFTCEQALVVCATPAGGGQKAGKSITKALRIDIFSLM